jgi:hypothetical protein
MSALGSPLLLLYHSRPRLLLDVRRLIGQVHPGRIGLLIVDVYVGLIGLWSRMLPALLAGLPAVEILLILPSGHYRCRTHPLMLSAASGT